MLRFLFLFTALVIFGAAYSQGSIKGRITDSTTNNPLALATVSVFTAADTTLVTYRLSNEEGYFKVTGIPLHVPCRVVITFSGYEVMRKEFSLLADTTLDLGAVVLAPSSKSLEEVLVRAERPPVTMRRDTIEFNASSFKTLPAALVEDLLKKLPGVQVDKAGNITANGKRVNRILVDGKSFFGDDPKMATRNLPASVIDKVQLADDKEEADRNIDFNPNDMGKVINLTLKKGIKKGWFGRTYAGAGTKDRYEAGGIVNMYRDTLQLSLVGFSNNIAKSSFSIQDISGIGGFDRSGFNSLSIGTKAAGGGFAINGISFGGMEPGISSSSGTGFNLNHAPNKKKSFFAQYFLGNNSVLVNDLVSKKDFFGDTVITSLSNTTNNKSSLSHNVSMGMNLKPDSLHILQFKVGFRSARLKEKLSSSIDLSDNQTGRLTTGQGNLFNNATEKNYNHEFFLTRKSPFKTGRVFQLNHWLNRRNSDQTYNTESFNQYFSPISYFDTVNQQRMSAIPLLSTAVVLQHAEPLSPQWTFKLQGRFEYLKDEQETTVFEKDKIQQTYTKLDSTQSNRLRREQQLAAPNIGIQYNLKKFSFSTGFTGQWQRIHQQQAGQQSQSYKQFNILPNLQVSWKGLNLRLNKSINLPPLSQLIAISDSSNPFFIRMGNPFLKPAKATNFSLNSFTVSKDRTMDYNFYANYTRINDDVIQDRRISSEGIQQVMPVNRNGSEELRIGAGISKEFKSNQSLQVSLQARAIVRLNKQSLLLNGVESKVTAYQYEPGFSIGVNWKDIIEIRPEYRYMGSQTRYTDPFFSNLNAGQHFIQSDISIRWPKDIILESNIEYRFSKDVALGLPKDNLLWNAGVSLQFLKDKKGMVKLGVYDLLNRNNNITRFATQNQVVDQQTNILQRYFLLTFTYSIRNIGVRGTKDRFQLF